MGNKKYTIYTLCCPVTGIVKYIGSTSSKLKYRLTGHICDSKRLSGPRHDWIESLTLKGLTPLIEPLEIIENDWENAEKYWIAQFRSWGFPLTNIADGGKGATGVRASSEKRRKQSIALKGKPKTKDHNLKVSIANKGRRHKKDFKEKCRQRMLGKRSKGLLRPITQYTKDDIFIANYECIRDAMKETGILETSIHNCLTNKTKSAGGFKWSYQNK